MTRAQAEKLMAYIDAVDDYTSACATGTRALIEGLATRRLEAREAFLATVEEAAPSTHREDEAYQHCTKCGRKTWSRYAFGQMCGMPQPGGEACCGVFAAPVPAATDSEQKPEPEVDHQPSPCTQCGDDGSEGHHACPGLPGEHGEEP